MVIASAEPGHRGLIHAVFAVHSVLMVLWNEISAVEHVTGGEDRAAAPEEYLHWTLDLTPSPTSSETPRKHCKEVEAIKETR